MFKIKKPTVCVNEMGDPIRVGDWKRQQELGSGGFGVVTLWMNLVDGDCLAIKKCKWHLESNLTPKQRHRWSAEVEMMKNIKNENIVCYRKMPEVLEKALLNSNPSKLPILSMEYCSMGNLRSELLKPQNSCGFHEIEVINLLKDVSNALIYLHNIHNVTHRDFKPENVVLQNCSTRKSGIIYKVIDLGYAKELGAATVSFVGTLQYLAPEMFTNKSYDKCVDYWSLGITAFEMICGIRPFLPAFSPMQSFDYVKKKDLDVICIQMTHTGDIKSSKELLKENHLNMCLKQNMETWFKSVLQYDPERRGFIENNNIDVFESLQTFLSKKIITVFSIYKFEFYSYEINESTLYSTLQDWIARDTKIQKIDQYLVATKKNNSNYAKDYYDEANSDAMLYVFKKNSCISEHVSASLPKLIKIMFENIKTEFKFGTLKLLSAQIIYFVHQEIKHFKSVKYGIYYMNVFLKDMVIKENNLFIDIRNSLGKLLSEIEFYNHIEISLCIKVYKDTNNLNLNSLLLEYESYLHQVKEIINTINALTIRHKKINSKNRLLQHAFIMIYNKLESCDFNTLSNQAIKSYDELIKQNPTTNLIARGELLKIITGTLKIRDTIMRDRYFLHFLKGATSYWSEMSKLVSCMIALKTHLTLIKENVRKNNINRLEILQDISKSKGENSNARDLDDNGGEIRKENVQLRYNMQEFLNSTILKYKNTAKEVDMLVGLENGIDGVVYQMSSLQY